MKEVDDIQRNVQYWLCRYPGCRVFRNQVGKYQILDPRTRRTRWLSSGLVPGSADLVGWVTIEITREMVGKKVAVFLSDETKVPGKGLRKEQKTWFQNVRDAGGIALVSKDPNSCVSDLKNAVDKLRFKPS